MPACNYIDPPTVCVKLLDSPCGLVVRNRMTAHIMP